MDWFPDLVGARVLCLACGGGQQTPVLAAAGADVTVLDNSPAQLRLDEKVARRDSLPIRTLLGDMCDLSEFEDGSFDLVFHPCSLSFVPEVEPVFREVHRVLRSGGEYLLGASNPINYVLDYEQLKQGELEFRHSIPYSDTQSLSESELKALVDEGEPLCFGHSLEQLIAGQTDVGLTVVGFYEDKWGSGEEAILDRYLPTFVATRARKI